MELDTLPKYTKYIQLKNRCKDTSNLSYILYNK